MSLEALKRNGHRLELGSFPTEGEYDIPIIQPVQLDKRLSWVRFNHALAIPKEQRSQYGVHFFIDDYLFERAWREPKRYALFLSDFAAVMSPDFSMFTDYPKAVQIYNHWRKHQLGAYWQSLGIKVIPTIGWIHEDSYSWCFDGEPVGSTVSISSVGTQKNTDARKTFLSGYGQMLERLKPAKVIFFGALPKKCAEMTAAVGSALEHHSPYYETFTKGLDFSLKER